MTEIKKPINVSTPIKKLEIIEEYLKRKVENQNGWGDEGEERPEQCLILLKEIKGIVEQHDSLVTSQEIVRLAEQLQISGIVKGKEDAKSKIIQCLRPHPDHNELVEKIHELYRSKLIEQFYPPESKQVKMTKHLQEIKKRQLRKLLQEEK